MAHVISDVLGRPVAYTRLSLPDVAAAMIQRGASDGVAHDMVEMISAQNAGIYEADQASAHPPPTRFRAWCEEVLRPAIRL